MIAWVAAVLLTGATLHSGDGPPQSDVALLIEGNRIAAIGADIDVPEGTERIELEGAVITPGLVDAVTRIGVVEVSGEKSAVEATLPSKADPVRAALRVRDTYDALSETVRVARAGGVTSAVVIPTGGLVTGQSIWADLVAGDAVRRDSLAVHVVISGSSRRGSRTAGFLRLRELLSDARLFRANRGAFIQGRLRDLSVSAEDLEVLARVVGADAPVVFHVQRRADLRSVLEIVRNAKLDAVIAGAAEGWLVADELARAQVPVIVDPLANLPSSYDTLHSRSDNAELLRRAGVTVAFSTMGSAHRVHRLRYAAGFAVAHGYPKEEALAAITRVPAEIFDIADSGVLRPGALANLVVWNGDPFEPMSWPTHVYIRGRAVDLRTRQDALTQRYLSR